MTQYLDINELDAFLKAIILCLAAGGFGITSVFLQEQDKIYRKKYEIASANETILQNFSYIAGVISFILAAAAVVELLVFAF